MSEPSQAVTVVIRRRVRDGHRADVHRPPSGSAVVYGLVLSIGSLVALGLGDAPPQLRLLFTITVEVFLMVYVLMPVITKRLARFIYPA